MAMGMMFCVPAPVMAATGTHGLSMFGELKYPANFSHFDYVNPHAPQGGGIVLDALGSFDNLNPFILKGSSGAGADSVFETLMEPSQDEVYSQYGLIAQSVTVANDHRSIHFVLRKEATWWDHSPITAADVCFSYLTLTTKGHPIFRNLYREVTACNVDNPHEVTFTLSNPTNRELPLLVGQMPILSKHYYQTHDFTKTTLEPPMASGPYQITKVEPGRSITYKRVKDYWGRHLPIKRGRANVDWLRYEYYRDTTVAVEAFKAGEYDLRLENVAKNWATAYDFPALHQGKVIKIEIPHQIPSGMQSFVFNTRRSPFNNREFRKALQYAFDFEWENKALFHGAYTRTNSYFANTVFAHEGLPSAAEVALLKPFAATLPKEIFESEPMQPKTDGSGHIRDNLLMARRILDKAGYKVKDFKLVDMHTSTPVKFEILLNSPNFERVAAPFVANLKRLGIDATIRTVDPVQYQKRAENFDFDMIVDTFRFGNIPGNEQMNFWHSSRANVIGSRNLAGIQNKAVDALVEAIIKADSMESLMAATRALDRVLLFHYYVIPNWYNRSFRLLYWNKFDRPAIAPKNDFGLDTWWVRPDAVNRSSQP
ncbi:MAG: ABC transporter substrate-binding protein [Alphaproteobacteria bacterium]|nr:ABC transporter substrate-binding protein [Alphaproteobacteria bacterium]